MEYNLKNNIKPISIKKSIRETLSYDEQFAIVPQFRKEEENYGDSGDLPKLISKLEKEMYKASKELEFEKAAQLRDRIKKIRDKELEFSLEISYPQQTNRS